MTPATTSATSTDRIGSDRKKVLRALKKLEESPVQRGQPLGNRTGTSLTTFRKLVVGDCNLRVVHRVEAGGRVAVVWVVGPRADNEVYDLAMTRLRLHGSEAATQVAEVLAQLWDQK